MKQYFIDASILLSILIMTTSCSPKVEMIPVELAYKAEATTGEGSIWHPERHTLFWVDIEGKTLYEYHPET